VNSQYRIYIYIDCNIFLSHTRNFREMCHFYLYSDARNVFDGNFLLLFLLLFHASSSFHALNNLFTHAAEVIRISRYKDNGVHTATTAALLVAAIKRDRSYTFFRNTIEHKIFKATSPDTLETRLSMKSTRAGTDPNIPHIYCAFIFKNWKHSRWILLKIFF